MAGAEERVQKIVRDDPFLYEALARGVLNKSGAARWIQEHRGVDAEEETIRSAIADLESEEELKSAAEVHPLLATAKLKLRPDIAAITLKRREGLKEPLVEFLGSLSLRKRETFHSAVNKEEILLILEPDRLSEAQQTFDSPFVEGTEEEVSEMRFHVEEHSSFGLLGIVLEVLAVRDIDILTVDGNSTEATVFIPTSQQRRALRVVDTFGLQATE